MELLKDMKKIFFCLLVFSFFVCVLEAFKKPTVQLNEIVACNNTTLYDNTGSFHDYIELYNATSQAIDISGYHLSDSKKNLDKFVFPPNTILSPKTYYLVWADQKPNEILVDNNFPYTGFSIKAGEKIYFSDNQQKIIDKIKVPKDLACDIS